MAFINQGILSNVLLLVIIILILTDWLSEVIHGFAKVNLIVALLMLNILLFSFEIPILGWRVNAGGYIIPSIIFMLLIIFKIRNRLYLLTATVLLGTTYFLIKELIRLDPILLVVKELYQITALIVFIVLLVVSAFEYRITLLFGGILIGEFLYHFHHRFQFTSIVLGDGFTRDILWLSVVQIIVFHYILSFLKDYAKGKEINWMRYRRIKND